MLKILFYTFRLVLVFTFLSAHSKANIFQKEDLEGSDSKYTYIIKRTSGTPKINAVWNKNFWENKEPVVLENYMGKKPSHFPETQVKLSYNENYIFLIFQVKDRYVKAVEKKINGKVWLDSCVEFFFSPGPDTDRGYFNFEANCKGVFLFQYHLNNPEKNEFVNEKDCEKIKIAHSLKRNVEKEHEGPLDWYIEYAIPISVLKKYMQVEKPVSGQKWRANFYKCADETSHPHWITWSPVEYPKPKFHLPEFFGWIEFE